MYFEYVLTFLLMYFLDFSKQKKHATTNDAYTSNLQAVNFELSPFRDKKDNVLFGSFFAFGPGPVLVVGLMVVREDITTGE